MVYTDTVTNSLAVQIKKNSGAQTVSENEVQSIPVYNPELFFS